MNNRGLTAGLVAGGTILLLLIIIGIASGVSLQAAFFRAILAALVIAVLLYALVSYIDINLLPNIGQQGTEDEKAEIGGRLDLTAGQEEDLLSILHASAPENTSTEDEPAEPAEIQFQPMPARQINPDLQKIIKENPATAAEVMRKMGLEE